MTTNIDWPGVGDVPEPEADGFREEQIDAEEERQERERDEARDRSKAEKERLSGKAPRKATPVKAAAKPTHKS